MKEIKGLLSVKRLIALALTGTFVYLSVTGTIDAEKFVPIYTLVVGYYYGQSTAKGIKGGE